LTVSAFAVWSRKRPVPASAVQRVHGRSKDSRRTKSRKKYKKTPRTR
jgi:hypothetical protein